MVICFPLAILDFIIFYECRVPKNFFFIIRCRLFRYLFLIIRICYFVILIFPEKLPVVHALCLWNSIIPLCHLKFLHLWRDSPVLSLFLTTIFSLLILCLISESHLSLFLCSVIFLRHTFHPPLMVKFLSFLGFDTSPYVFPHLIVSFADNNTAYSFKWKS